MVTSRRLLVRHPRDDGRQRGRAGPACQGRWPGKLAAPEYRAKKWEPVFGISDATKKRGRTPVDAAPAGRGGADFVVGRPAAKLGAPRILAQAPGQLAIIGLRERDCWFQGYATVPQAPPRQSIVTRMGRDPHGARWSPQAGGIERGDRLGGQASSLEYFGQK